MSTLRQRCVQFIERKTHPADDPVDLVDDLMAFVLAEEGRAADPRLQESLPLVLYCGDEESREAVIAAFASRPGVRSRKMP